MREGGGGEEAHQFRRQMNIVTQQLLARPVDPLELSVQVALLLPVRLGARAVRLLLPLELGVARRELDT